MPDFSAFPEDDALVTLPKTLKGWGRLTQAWLNWFSSLQTATGAASQRLHTVSLTAQQASIGTTPIPTPALPAGLYRLTTYARITQAATTSSSLTVTLGWTETGITLTFSTAALTGNTTTTVQSETRLIRMDAGLANYATTYASVGGVPMQYRLDITLERVDA